jgi:hypothetical protein
MDSLNSIEGILKKIIQEETLYLRHYIGKVLDNYDIDGKAKIKVSIQELGWTTPELAAICYPRQTRSLITPQVGEWVEVYFLGGNKMRPVWMGIAYEMQDMLPKSYKDITSHVIFDHAKTKDNIVYSDSEKSLTTVLSGKLNVTTKGDMNIDAGSNKVTICQGTEPGVLGQALVTWLTTFFNSKYNVHTHIVAGITAGGGSVTSAVTTSIQTAPTTSDFCSTQVKLK